MPALQLITPDDLCKTLCEAGGKVSERTIREKARRLGAYRMVGKTMFLNPGDVATIISVYYSDNDKVSVFPVEKIEKPRPYLAEEGHFLSVYFIFDGEFVKIGETRNVTKRLKHLQTANSRKLTLLKIVSGGKNLESELHERFRSYRIRGEWFRLEGRLKAYLRSSLKKLDGDQT